ncbi:hypothetical protein [Paramaledivibacter caminithermalis]|uniref:Uncharacterized protein n=1 Tax=Paramaledivibacter caminithermalis (strain DSM 15212 / CIP 107654 / DViRD3) TaxID=1121301 RepID=A0A1M6TRI5_PARC5|nr:hypothetical protein [Paramaledivibacter caminithermalis]SHK59448.1 hypothetical protein SAMN02745912_03768 [Paramaledivibacter caminithermalis DSM 15212]
MTFINNILTGYKLLYEKFISNLSCTDYICILFTLIGLNILIYLVFQKILERHKKRKYLIRRKNFNIEKYLTEIFSKNKFIEKLVIKIAYKISIYNTKNFRKNKEYASIIFSLSILMLSISMPTILKIADDVWYVALVYLIILIAFISLTIYFFSMKAKTKFTNELPKCFRLINSRYIDTDDILKAIDLTIDDVNNAVKRELIRIHDALKFHSQKEVKDTFDFIDSIYKDRYLTILLNLIYQGYYKGGKEGIKEEFEETTEEILIDLEHQKDLAMVTRAFIGLSLTYPIILLGAKKFNERALGNESIIFYNTPLAKGFEISIYMLILILIGILCFEERAV